MLKIFSQNDRLIKSESLLGPNAFLPGFFSILGLFFKIGACLFALARACVPRVLMT